MAFLEYLATEVAEDWTDGLISRREALRRLAMLGLSATAGAAVLAACAAPAAPASGPGSSNGIAASPTTAPTPAASSSGAPGAGESITFAGEQGEFQGHLASAIGPPAGAMLVIHENRGLTDHIRSVAGRLAADGYSALAVDLSPRRAARPRSATRRRDAALWRAPAERLVADMRAGLDELARRAPGAKLGIIGFCFGGGMVWTLLDAGEPRLAAAVPFYGPAPDGARLRRQQGRGARACTRSWTTASTLRATGPRPRSKRPG